MSKKSAIKQLKEKLFMWLDEIWEEYSQGDESEFLLGEIYGYVECLEIILQSEGVDNETILALESRYGIR